MSELVLGSAPLRIKRKGGRYVDGKNYDSFKFKWPKRKQPDFDENVYKILKYIYYDKNVKIMLGDHQSKIQLFPFQKIIGEYIKESQYRGLLIYHGLGSGKTITAINVINLLRKPTLIFLPAALRSSWKQKYLDKFVDKRLTVKFMSYNAPNLISQYDKINPEIFFDPSINSFDNHFIIIDESHEFFQNVISGKAEQAIKIFRLLMNAKNIKLLFLTGTPIIGDPFELVPCFNLLAGFLGEKKHNLFPTDRETFYKYFAEGDDIKNEQIFSERITGLVSYHMAKSDDPTMASQLPLEIVECKMGTFQWKRYLTVVQKERDLERKHKYIKKSFKVHQYKKPVRESVGTYKANTAECCNFPFTEEVNSDYNRIKENYLVPNGFGVGKTIDRKIWKTIEKDFKLHGPWPSSHRVAEIKYNIMSNHHKISELYRDILSLSPKLGKLITKLTTGSSRIKKFVYTRFKTVGTRLIGEILVHKKYERIISPLQLKQYILRRKKGKRFMIIDGDTRRVTDMIRVFNHNANTYGEYCQILLGTQVTSKGISLRAIRETHILEPQWRNVNIEQIRGRAVRTHSHALLPPNERYNITYLYISVPLNRAQMVKNVLHTDPGSLLTTDEFLYKNAVKKANFHNKFLELLRFSAIDCRLKFPVTQCKTCSPDIVKASKHNDKITLFPPNIIKHIAMGPVCQIMIEEYDKDEVDLKKIEKNLYKSDDGRVYEFQQDLMGNGKGNFMEVGYLTEDGLISFYG